MGGSLEELFWEFGEREKTTHWGKVAKPTPADLNREKDVGVSSPRDAPRAWWDLLLLFLSGWCSPGARSL